MMFIALLVKFLENLVQICIFYSMVVKPLLRFNEIRQIVEKIENSCFSKYVKYLIQTNGIYINSEVIEFFKKYGFGVGISIDGFTDVSNINRLDFNGKSTTKKLLLP